MANPLRTAVVRSASWLRVARAGGTTRHRAGLRLVIGGSAGAGCCYYYSYHQRPLLGTATTGCSPSSQGKNDTTNSSVLAAPSTTNNGDSTDSSLVVPTFQAALRAARLLRTVTMMAADYQLSAVASSWNPRKASKDTSAAASPDVSSHHDDSQQELLEYWEAETERRYIQFEQAQENYSTDNVDKSLPPEERRKLQRQQKNQMNEAAQQLAHAEQELAALSDGHLTSPKSAVHKRCAERLLNLCRKNGGVYIKVGQHLANLDYLIPPEYCEVLRSLWDDTPQTAYPDVVQVLREDLGADPNELFDDFDPEPIASASLAQVHVAYDRKTGRKLAVKVQHRGLRETATGDVFCLVSVVRLCQRLFSGFTYAWLADEIAPQLPRELDFLNEGRNAERAAANLRPTGLPCVVPRILWNLSSPRVLTMEFEPGFKATDVDAMAKAGLNKRDVSKLISSVFASQIFLSSFVHCDPHPANVLIRVADAHSSGMGKKRPEMVLVDHGLYRELDADFTLSYSHLWQSLMLADLPGIKEACAQLGVGKDVYPLFSAMLTARPFDEILERAHAQQRGASLLSRRQTSSSTVQRQLDPHADKTVIRGYAQRFLYEILDLLHRIPRQMLLLLKTNDCLRHIDYSLGSSPTNSLVVCGHYAAQSIYQHQLQNASSYWGMFRAWLDYSRVCIRIALHDMIMRWTERSIKH